MQLGFDDLKGIAQELRARSVLMVHNSGASHLGSCLSIADIVACLYWNTLRIDPAHPEWPERDRFILSKGHAAAMVYAALAERGFISVEELETYCKSGSRLTGHITSGVPGVELSSGSLGHGLPVGCGMALAAKRENLHTRTVVLCSDGEMDEGSNWEAVLFAPQYKLDNLLLIVDYNKIQSYGRVKEVLDLDPLSEKFRSFRWAVREVDGHNMQQLVETFAVVPFEPGKPSVVIANTIKGKGVSFMENQLAWHYRTPNDEQVATAMRELGVSL
jgi:transketolase